LRDTEPRHDKSNNRVAQDKDVPDMLATAKSAIKRRIVGIAPSQLKPNQFSLSIYGDPASEIDDLLVSIRTHGILVALVVTPGSQSDTWEVLSGHRRLACALALELSEVPCEIRQMALGEPRRGVVLDFNRQRRKTFSQLMREADAIEKLWAAKANVRRLANLHRGLCPGPSLSVDSDRPNSDDRAKASESVAPVAGNGRLATNPGRTDTAIARYLQLGGKDIYRQARAIWRLSQAGDVRAQNGVAQLDAGTKTIHAAYKDLRRRDRFRVDFRPTPYDVWSFRHDRAFGIPHPGDIPPAIIAHALYYFTPPDGMVVDPMAGGGTTLDVCESMGRRCLAYDLHPARPEIRLHDIRHGYPAEASGCDLIFCDPPYHTMLARHFGLGGSAALSLTDWVAFLNDLSKHSFTTLRAGGYLALLLAAQTEKDLPAGFGYLDHAFFGYAAAISAGFLPVRRISCPMDGAYLPQHVRRARTEGRLLGQVRDLLVMQKPSHHRETLGVRSPLLQNDIACVFGSRVADSPSHT
jgi:ParB family chromosome partitioning protein